MDRGKFTRGTKMKIPKHKVSKSTSLGDYYIECAEIYLRKADCQEVSDGYIISKEYEEYFV